MKIKNGILEIALWNFLFIILIGLLRFYYFFVIAEQDAGKNIFIFSIITTIALISFAIFLAYIARYLTNVKNKKNFIKIIWPYYLFAALNIDISIVPFIVPLYNIFYFSSTEGIDVTIFSILFRFILSIPVIFIPSYLLFKSQLQLKNLERIILQYKNYIYGIFIALIILILIFSFGSLVFALNPACAIKTIPIDDNLGDLCFIPIATLTGNVDYCHNDYYYSDNCFKVVAKVKNDPSVCSNVIYMDGLLRYNEYTCITQFFDKEDGYKNCYVFDDKGFQDRCVEQFVGWNLNMHSPASEKYYEYLLGLCHNISYGPMSYCAVATDEYEHMTRLERSKNDTLFLFKKYKEILKDKNKFKNELLNPRDIDFCKLTSLLTEDSITGKSNTIYDPEDQDFFWSDEPYKILCYGNFGKNPKAEKYCDMAEEDPNHSLKMVCQGGIYFNEYRGFYNFSQESDTTSPYAQGYSIGNPTFQLGFGAVAGYTDFNLSAYMNAPLIIVKDEWSGRENIEISGTYVDDYFKMKNFAENLQPVKFCDIIQAFKKECKEIVES